MSWSREKQELRRKICQAARQIAQAGYVAANDGNLSARCSDGGVLITPSGVYKGDLEAVSYTHLSLEDLCALLELTARREEGLISLIPRSAPSALLPEELPPIQPLPC